MIVDHPNIIKLYETYEDELYLHLVMELCTGGDICERIITKGYFSEARAAGLMKQLFGAVNYLHINNITHRDLKAENFIYESEKSENIKICDFGMSIINNGKNKMRSLAGTPFYLAPEILNGPYTKACDVWSLGVFLYFILTGKHPFKGGNLDSIYLKASQSDISIFKPEDFHRISDGAKDLIRKMLTVQVNKRISLKECLNHPWLLNYDPVEEKIPEDIFQSFCKYKAKNKLWQEATKIIVKNLSNPQIELLRNAFVAMDTTNSGYITAEQLQLSMKNNGFHLASNEIENIIENVFYLKKGKINYSEFLVVTLNRKALMNEEVMWEAFKMFDEKNQGKINVKDLQSALKRAGCEFSTEEFGDLIFEAKIDENSDIDFENFKIIMDCFEEENEFLSENTRRMSLVRKMSKDFKTQFLKAMTINKEKTIES